MSVTKTYTVWCDVGECCARTVATGVADTADTVRREAKREGWVRKGRADLCPFHARMSREEATTVAAP